MMEVRTAQRQYPKRRRLTDPQPSLGVWPTLTPLWVLPTMALCLILGYFAGSYTGSRHNVELLALYKAQVASVGQELRRSQARPSMFTERVAAEHLLNEEAVEAEQKRLDEEQEHLDAARKELDYAGLL